MDTVCSCYEGHRLLRLGTGCCAMWRWRDLGSRPYPASDTEIQESYRKGIVKLLNYECLPRNFTELHVDCLNLFL